MSIGCIRNTNDLQNKRKEYAEYLQLMIDNESIKEKRIKDYKNPNKPPAVPPQYKTVAEQNKDLQLQERQAIDNAKDLGLDISEARSFVIQLEQKQDGIDNLVKLNKNFPAFKKLVSERLNPKSLEANAVLNLWEEFSANLSVITGLNSVSSNATSAYSSATDNYMKIPTQNKLIKFKKTISEEVFQDTDLVIPDSLKTNVLISVDNAIKFSLDDSTVEKIDEATTPLERRGINKLAEQLLSTYKIPTKNEIEVKTKEIADLYDSFGNTGVDNVSINDSISKALIILTRYLSVFSDETVGKRLTEYNGYVNKLISGFTSEVKLATEGTIPTEQDIDESEILRTKAPTTKTGLIKYIINYKIYNNTDKYGNSLIPDFDITRPESEIEEYLDTLERYELAEIVRDNKARIKEEQKEKERQQAEKEGLATATLGKFLKKKVVSPYLTAKDEEYRKEAELSRQQQEIKEGVASKKIVNFLTKQTVKSKTKKFKDAMKAFDDLELTLSDYKIIAEEMRDVLPQENIEEYNKYLYMSKDNKKELQQFIIGVAISVPEAGEFLDIIYDEAKNEKELKFREENPEEYKYRELTDNFNELNLSLDKYRELYDLIRELLPDNERLNTKDKYPIYVNKKLLQDFIMKKASFNDEIENIVEDYYNKIPYVFNPEAPDIPIATRKPPLKKIYTAKPEPKPEPKPFPKPPSFSPKPQRDFKGLNNRQRQPKIFEIPENSSNRITDTYEYVKDKIESMSKSDFLYRFNASDLTNAYDKYDKEQVVPNIGYSILRYSDGGLYISPQLSDKINEAGIANFSRLFSIKQLTEILLDVEFAGARDLGDSLKKVIGIMISGKNYEPDVESMRQSDVRKFQGFGMKKNKKKGGDLIHIDIGSHIGKNYKEAEGKGVKQQMKLFEKVKKNYQSGGDQPYIKSRIKIGSGVAVAEKEPTYQEFGKFVIHIPQLRKNILNVKYASGSRPQYLPIVNIDDDTKDLLVSTLETGKMSENQFNKLPQPAKDFLIKAIKGAGLQNQLFKGKDKLYATEEKEDRDRFNILKGEFDAGNDNPNLIKELRGLVIKFIDTRIIPKKQGLEFLRQLN